jgi:hypothetical protein
MLIFSSSSLALLPWKMRFIDQPTGSGNGLQTYASHMEPATFGWSCERLPDFYTQ